MTVDVTGTSEDAISGSDRSGSLTIYRQYDPDSTTPLAEGALSITGKGCGIFTQGNLTINGGQISARSTNAVALAAKDNLAIYGGKVTASAISAQNDVTLGLSAADDYIKAGSFAVISGAVKTATGCRFVALDESAGEGLPTAIVPGGAQAHTPAAAGDGFALSDIAGRTLRPVDGYLLVSAMATGMFKTGEFQISKLEGEVGGKHFDCSGFVPGGANPILVADESALTKDASGHSTLSGTSTLGEVGLAGTGKSENLNEMTAAANEIIATQGMQTVATCDGQSSTVDLCAKSVAGESNRYSFQDESGQVVVEVDVPTVPPVDEATKLTHEDAEAIINSVTSANQLATVLCADITATSSPATISFTVNGTAPVQKIYVFHYVDGAWKIEGSGEPKTVTVTVDKLSRTRAGGAERPKASFVPMDIDPYKVLPKGAVVLFMSQNQLLSIANFQRENPDLVNKARARGSLMIDTTTPETTALVAHAMVTEREQPGDGHWYGLDGRRLPSAPTAKGVYVHRGRKVVIR